MNRMNFSANIHPIAYVYEFNFNVKFPSITGKLDGTRGFEYGSPSRQFSPITASKLVAFKSEHWCTWPTQSIKREKVIKRVRNFRYKISSVYLQDKQGVPLFFAISEPDLGQFNVRGLKKIFIDKNPTVFQVSIDANQRVEKSGSTGPSSRTQPPFVLSFTTNKGIKW